MAISTDQLLEVILAECGADTDPKAQDLISSWYELEAQNALATKIRVLEYLQGKHRKDMDLGTGTDRVAARHRFLNVTEMLRQAQDKLAQSIAGDGGAGSGFASHQPESRLQGAES